MEQLEQSDDVIDLHSRQNCGLNITLWYVRSTLKTFVTVEDTYGVNFSFDIAEGEDAWYEYHHAMVRTPAPTQNRSLYA